MTGQEKPLNVLSAMEGVANNDFIFSNSVRDFNSGRGYFRWSLGLWEKYMIKFNDILLQAIAELLSFSLIRKSISQDEIPNPEKLYEHERILLTFLSQNRPETMCFWLSEYMRKFDYIK